MKHHFAYFPPITPSCLVRILSERVDNNFGLSKSLYGVVLMLVNMYNKVKINDAEVCSFLKLVHHLTLLFFRIGRQAATNLIWLFSKLISWSDAFFSYFCSFFH